MSDELKKQFDAFYLFVRTDEKYEQTDAKVHDLELKLQNLENLLTSHDNRINKGLAITGQNNAKDIAEQGILVGKLTTTVNLLNQSINNPETGVFKQIKDMKDRVDKIYNGILGIFFTVLCGGGILYALRYFRVAP